MCWHDELDYGGSQLQIVLHFMLVYNLAILKVTPGNVELRVIIVFPNQCRLRSIYNVCMVVNYPNSARCSECLPRSVLYHVLGELAEAVIVNTRAFRQISE